MPTFLNSKWDFSILEVCTYGLVFWIFPTQLKPKSFPLCRMEKIKILVSIDCYLLWKSRILVCCYKYYQRFAESVFKIKRWEVKIVLFIHCICYRLKGICKSEGVKWKQEKVTESYQGRMQKSKYTPREKHNRKGMKIMAHISV